MNYLSFLPIVLADDKNISPLIALKEGINCSDKLSHYFTLIPNEASNCLFQKFQSGLFELSDVIFYIKYITEVLLFLSASISVIAIIYGGYLYMLSFALEDQDSGKKWITNAILGLSISILSWVIINTVLYIAFN